MSLSPKRHVNLKALTAALMNVSRHSESPKSKSRENMSSSKIISKLNKRWQTSD
jgi:hypothetical protein